MSDRSAAQQLIADIGRESGLNQAELARRAGLTRSVLSAYARGRRQPGVDALVRIAAAAGLEVRIGLPGGSSQSGRLFAGAGEWPVAARQRSAAGRMARTRAAWARGGAEGKELDRLQARRMSHDQRIDEGLALVRIAEQLQAGRSVR
jgi:transcriptional regulator with XRE-family HTH domain